MSQLITFAANNEFFRKRKRVHRACESCKKRRKRCSHTFDDEPDTGSSTQNGLPVAGYPTSDPSSNHMYHPAEMRPHAARSDSHGHVSRDSPLTPQSPLEDAREKTPPNFLGYLNPEAVLREQVHERGKHAPAQALPPVGQWVQERQDDREIKFNETQPVAGSTPGTINDISTSSSQPAAVQRTLQAYLDAVNVTILPAKEHQDALLQVYFTYVQPLLPIVDKHLFRARYAQGTEPSMLMQAICIVASKHADAAPHLYLPDEPRLLNPREFSQRLYNSIIAAIEAKLEKNRIVLIQTLALISLHCEGPDGAEQASMHLAQAIHHAHTFGLQFGHQWKHSRTDSLENLGDLFWCLWSLDKINACINGRPLIMNDRDNTLTKLPSDPEKRQSPFGVWLQIAEMLDKVIDYYRPGRSPDETGWEEDFLGFEEMVGDGEDKLEGPFITCLSIFHHTMCMASHKSLSINDPVRSTPSYVRQSLSATRVISILNTESPERLPPLPIIPYALSMALSVVYRHFRQRRLKMHRNRAKDELKQCVVLLNRLRSSWWSAGTMADLGTAVLNNAERNTRPTNTPAADTSHPQAPSVAPTPAQSGGNWQQPNMDSSIDPRLQSAGQPATPISSILNHMPTPGQHPTSSERSERGPLEGFDFTEPSPDWLNFDTAFENFDTLLGSSGADLSNELFKPFNYEGLEFLDGAVPP